MPQSLHRDSVVKLEESFTQPSDRRTLTDIEVAARLGVSRFTVRSWRLNDEVQFEEETIAVEQTVG